MSSTTMKKSLHDMLSMKGKVTVVTGKLINYNENDYPSLTHLQVAREASVLP